MSRRFMSRSTGWAATVLLVGTVWPLASTAPAHAAVLITCTAGTDSATYNPGLKLTSQNGVALAASDSYSSCPSAGSTASSTASATLDGISCVSLGLLQQYAETVTWGSGSGSPTSTISYTVSTPLRTGDTLTVVLEGTVTAGLYKGYTVIKTVVDVVGLDELVACVSSGLTSITGSATLELTSV